MAARGPPVRTEAPLTRTGVFRLLFGKAPASSLSAWEDVTEMPLLLWPGVRGRGALAGLCPWHVGAPQGGLPCPVRHCRPHR